MKNQLLPTIALALMSLWTLLNGLKLFFTKKPILFTARINFLFIMIYFSPPLISTLFNGFKFGLEYGLDLVGLVLILAIVLLFGLMWFYWWRVTRGYVVVGVTEDSLRESLKCVLKRLNSGFKESPSGFQLTADSITLDLNIQRWSGSGRLELKGVKNPSVLRDIVKDLREEYVSSPPKVNFRAGTVNIIISLVLIALATALFVNELK